MKRLFLLFLIPFLCHATGWQLRLREIADHQLDDNWKIRVAAEQRWKYVINDFKQHFYDIGLIRKLENDWYLRGFYRHRIRPVDNKWRTSAELLGDVIKKWEWSSLHFANRARWQFRFLDHKWIIRNRVYLSYHAKHFHLFLTEEVFFEKLLTRLIRNRWEIGLLIPFCEENHRFTIGYQQQHKEGLVEWVHDANILRFRVHFRF